MRPQRYAVVHRAARAAIWLAAFLPVAAQAAGAFSKPVLGYVFDSGGKTIRAIAGVPGSAVLDEAVASATKLDRAFVAPGRSFAIAELLGADAAVLLSWNGHEVSNTELQGTLPGATLVAFSTGEFAAIFYKDSGRLQVWSGLPAAPVLSRTIEAADVRALAISDDGSLVAAAQENGVALYDGDEGRIVAGGTFPSIAFRPGTHDLLAAEPFLGRIVSIANGEVVEVASIAEPGGVAASRDGKWTLVAAADGLFLTSAEAPLKVAEGTWTIAGALHGDSVFLVTDNDGAQWVLDFDTGEPRLVLAGGAQ